MGHPFKNVGEIEPGNGIGCEGFKIFFTVSVHGFYPIDALPDGFEIVGTQVNGKRTGSVISTFAVVSA